jgi:hypothetical protein
MILILIFMFMLTGLSIGVALHLQLVLWTIAISGLFHLVGLPVKWYYLLLLLDMALLAGIGLLFAWVLSRTDTHLVRMARGAADWLKKISPDFAPDDPPRMLAALALLLVAGLLPATMVIFGASTMAWEASKTPLFLQDHNELDLWLYTFDLFLNGSLYSAVQHLGWSISQLEPATWSYYLYSKAYQWALSIATAALLWRVFYFLFKMRRELLEPRRVPEKQP